MDPNGDVTPLSRLIGDQELAELVLEPYFPTVIFSGCLVTWHR